jgi:hypothetical protein
MRLEVVILRDDEPIKELDVADKCRAIIVRPISTCDCHPINPTGLLSPSSRLAEGAI